jgi:hypothetical protein
MNDRDNDVRPDVQARVDIEADIAAIAGLLPAPAPSNLPRALHLHHKEQLMQHIDRDQATPSSRLRRLPRPAFLVPLTALALGGLLAAGITLTTGDDAPPTTTATRDTTQPAAVLLHQISTAAGRGDALKVRDDQFAYTRAKVRGADLTSGKAVVGPLRETETWLAQEPGPLHKLGLTKTDGETLPINAELGDTKGTPAGLSRPTYHWLSALPTDPDRLLTYLYAKAPKSDRQERSQTVFDCIGSLLGEVMPPKTAAALYQAAAKIPGVSEAPAAHDAIGRHGVGIAREDTTFQTRTEWVFNQQDLTFLGARSYLVKDTSYGKKGTLMSGTALIDHAVVDKAGQEPATSRQS